MVEYVIETRNLCKKYSKDLVVDSLNMHVEKGKIYGLLGKNGAGKTTTMCMILNLVSLSGGEILLFGKNSKKASKTIYSNIGSIIETPGFYENLTGFENLKILSKLRGEYNPSIVRSVLDVVNLGDACNKQFKDYSLGMKQRLGIAAAMMHNPELLILDEPINGLDPFGIKEIRHLLKKLSNEYGTTILISSHILSEIENIADVIGVMDNGVLIDEISKEDLHGRLNKFVDFEVSNLNLAIELLTSQGLCDGLDFVSSDLIELDKNNSLSTNLSDVQNDVESGEIRLFTNLDLRNMFNELFVTNGIQVTKVNLCEENLEDFFTRLVS